MMTIWPWALDHLAPRRTTYWLGDSGVTLHLLASLHAQIHERLADAVADARDQDYSWPRSATSWPSPGPEPGTATAAPAAAALPED
jgi:hypothetical protein